MSALILSLDFELFWGVAESRTIEGYRHNIEGVWEAIPKMLDLFRRYEIRVTWATVGMLMCRDYAQWREMRPDVLPSYDRQQCSTYLLDSVVKNNAKLFFARPLVEQILMTNGQELASHTFSHFFCAEPGIDTEQFETDCVLQKVIFAEYGLVPTSLILPRNQIRKEFLLVAAKNGITTYRGNQKHWLYRDGHFTPFGIFGRVVRKVDGYISLSGDHISYLNQLSLCNMPFDISSSMFFRPTENISFLDRLHLLRIKHGMELAAMSGAAFHLWWHPHNFGVCIQRNLNNLETLLQFYSLLADKYNMRSLSMTDAFTSNFSS